VADRYLPPIPELPAEVEELRCWLLQRYGTKAHADMWRYVSWYDARFGIEDAEVVWIRAVNRTAERYRQWTHKTGATPKKRSR
jgi:hypothetical protein